MQLILGTAQLRRAYGAVQRRESRLDSDAAHGLLRHAEALAVDALDTAPVYGDAEATIGSSRSTLPVHTKLDPSLTPADSVRRSLQQLRRNRVDLLYVHDPAEVLDKSSPVLAQAHELVGSLVQRLGVSVYEQEEFDAAVDDPRVQVVQVPMNLFDRRFCGSALKRAHDAGTEVYVRSILLQGLLADPETASQRATASLRPHLDQFGLAARSTDRPALQLAIGWVASQAVDGMILGADSERDLDELVVAARHTHLAPSDLRTLTDMDVPTWPAADPRTWSH